VNYGNFGFVQGKASISGPLAEKIAGRVSFSGTTRQGQVHNVVTGEEPRMSLPAHSCSSGRRPLCR